MEEKARNFLIWLISPIDDKEKELFKNCVDDYIYLMSKIPDMSMDELVVAINKQLEPYGKFCTKENFIGKS